MIIRIVAYNTLERGVWDYTFQTSVPFNEFIINGCLIGEKEPLELEEKMYGGGYDVDVRNWSLDIDVFNPRTIKRLDKYFDLQISFFPESIGSFTFGISEIPDNFSTKKKEVLYTDEWLKKILF